MHKDLLSRIGMNDSEIAVYSALLEKGLLSVTEIAKITGLKRANLYNVLEHLVQKKTVEKVESKKGARFQVTDPGNLLLLAEEEERHIKENRKTLESILPSLRSLHQKVREQPFVRSWEGMHGIKRVYDNIIDTGEDILLLRSTHDNDLPALKKLVYAQIDRQVEAGIHARIIAPYVSNTRERIQEEDKKNLVERRIVPLKDFSLPAQIIIYGDKVAITDLQGEAYVSTIIDNDSIAETFRILFNFIWTLTKDEDKAFRERIED